MLPLRRSTVRFIPLAALASLLSLASPRTAHAQAAAQADALIEHGIQLREKGHDDQALLEFRHAYALSPSPRARAQMALAEQAVGSWVLADQHLAEALAATSDPWISARRAILTTAAGAIAQHLGTLVVTGVAPPGAEARVVLDGVDVGPLPLTHPVRLETGSRLLEVRAPGFYPVVRTIGIAAGATAREMVTLVLAPPGVPEAGAVAASTAPPVEKLTEGGAPGPGAFHAAFYPGGPAGGVWTLHDDNDAILCKLPCGYWLDGQKHYSLVRTPMMSNDSELRLTPITAFTEGTYIQEQIKGPSGSRVAAIFLGVGGLAVETLGIALYATADTSISTTTGVSGGGYEQAYLGVIAMIAGGFATIGGVVMFVISDPWRVDARGASKPVASWKLDERGLGLTTAGMQAWVTPAGLRGSF